MLDKDILNMTFGQVEGRKLVFLNENRPFKRCLNYQAILARENAPKYGVEFQFKPYGSESSPDPENVIKWLNTIEKGDEDY